MARTKAQKKGDELEDAVHLIETVILRSNPNTKEATIIIDTKKRVTVQGVRSEIDVYVSVKLGNVPELIYIFECKNREEPVNKNDIIVFNDKIQEVGAQKGYFVARKFGIDAINKAKRYQRIELLEATDEFETLPIFVANFHIVNDIIALPNLSLSILNNDAQKVGTHTFTNESHVIYKGEELLLVEFAKRIANIVKNEVMSHEPTGTFNESVYPFNRTRTFTFKRFELFVDGLECTALDTHVFWDIQVIRPKIVSKFDVKTRGRVIKVESGELPTGGNVQVSFIETK
jgi:hypothetical protein